MSNTLCEPPRRLSAKLKFHLLCSGFMNQFGWGILGFTMIHVWAFVFTATPWTILIPIAIFPTLGIIFILSGMRQGSKMIYLMKNGESAPGSYVGKEATNTRINKQRVFRMFYTFKDSLNQEHKAECRTHLTENLKEKEDIFYDPLNPNISAVFDNSKNYYRISAYGDIELAGRGLLLLFLPSLVLIVHGSIFVYYCLTH